MKKILSIKWQSSRVKKQSCAAKWRAKWQWTQVYKQNGGKINFMNNMAVNHKYIIINGGLPVIGLQHTAS